MAVTVGLLAGCGASRSSFEADANKACVRSSERIAKIKQPQSPHEALGYGLDIYAEKDRLLTILDEMDLPAGDAKALRDEWLLPARHDLADGRAVLRKLRTAALAGQQDTVDTQLTALTRMGSAGVDDGLLDRLGLGGCRVTFGTSTR